MEEVKRTILTFPKKEQIVLEILEDEIDQKTLDLIISSMAGEGIKIFIDDFGTKSSNFDRVLKYKSLIESIKIDRVVWKNMQYVIKSLVEEMKDIKIIAEKVKTEVELKSLLDMGVVLFQGWYFKDNFDKLVKNL
ncbi:MAG: EAL domain-containing protein [Hydrogenothermaceae bacterium]|nr:EAL domain-containing protein [Hydrogenothermaceae bacterium]